METSCPTCPAVCRCPGTIPVPVCPAYIVSYLCVEWVWHQFLETETRHIPQASLLALSPFFLIGRLLVLIDSRFAAFRLFCHDAIVYLWCKYTIFFQYSVSPAGHAVHRAGIVSKIVTFSLFEACNKLLINIKKLPPSPCQVTGSIPVTPTVYAKNSP